MLIIALVLALIGLAALVFAVVTSNAVVAWVCIGASALGVLLLIVDALRERRREHAQSVAESVAERVEAERVKVRPREVAEAGGTTEPALESADVGAAGETPDELAVGNANPNVADLDETEADGPAAAGATFEDQSTVIADGDDETAG